MSEKMLYKKLVRLAHQNPGPVRDALLPILKGTRTAGGASPILYALMSEMGYVFAVRKNRSDLSKAKWEHLESDLYDDDVLSTMRVYTLKNVPSSLVDDLLDDGSSLDGWEKGEIVMNYMVGRGMRP